MNGTLLKEAVGVSGEEKWSNEGKKLGGDRTPSFDSTIHHRLSPLRQAKSQVVEMRENINIKLL